MDLFEYVRTLLGCEYISDIRSPEYLSLAGEIFSKMDLSGYEQREIEDMREYLGMKKPHLCKQMNITEKTVAKAQ